MKQPILIVGAGPVGLVLALELKRQGVDVRIIDKDPYRHQENRAVALQSSTLEVFQKLGLHRELLSRGKKLYHLKIYDDNEIALDLDFSKLVVPNPFIFVVPQKESEDLLVDALLKHEVEVERKTKLTDYKAKEDHIEAHLLNDQGQEEIVQTPYLIGCDGAKSLVRKLMGTEFNRVGDAHDYLLADAVLFWNHKPDSYRIFLHSEGSVTFIPLCNNQYRVICDLFVNKYEDPTSPSIFRKLVKERVSGSLEIEDLVWVGQYKRAYRESDRFRRGRVILAGDAAHVHSPIEGEGINLGIQDAMNLAWKLAFVQQNIADKELLKSYSRERKPIVEQAIKRSNKLLNISKMDSTIRESLRTFTLNFYQNTSLLKQMVTYDLAGIAARTKNSPIVKSYKRWLFFRPAITAGCRMFDAKLVNPLTKLEIQAFSLLCSPKHQLFIFFRKKNALKALNFKETLNERYADLMGVHLISPDECPDLKHYWFDQGAQLAKPFKLIIPFSVLVRPDQHIGLTTRGYKSKDIDYYFENLLKVFPKN